MECHFWFFYSKEVNLKVLLNHLQKVEEPYRIITNNAEVQDYLSKHGKNVLALGDLFPENAEITETVYQEARKIRNEYRKIFKNIVFKDIKIFRAFEYHLLLQLAVIIKGKWLLKEKKNTVFIFEKFSPSYFGIMKIAKEMNYKNEIDVGFLKGKKIEYFKSTNENNSITYAEMASRHRAINFAKHGFGKGVSLEKIQRLLKFGFSVLRLFLKGFFYNAIQKKEQSINLILKKIDKKILNSTAKYDAICGIFLTASRLDIYLKPMFPVIEKFHKNNTPIQIFTSDISTSLVLSKEKISVINMFEEVNLTLNLIKNSEDGKKIKTMLEKLVIENENILGFDELFHDLLRRTYRTMAIIVILDNIFKKMKFKTILDGGTGEEFENTAIELALKHNIISYSFVPSPPSPYPQFSDWWHSDKTFLEGLQGLEVMKKLGYEEDRFEIVGGARFDHYKLINSSDSKNFLKENFQISKEKKLIVFVMSRWHDNDENWIPRFIKFCNKKNFEIIMKIHPTYKVASQNVSEKKIMHIESKCKGMKYIITYDVDLTTLLSASEMVITDWSSVGLAAILLGKPLLQVNFTKEEIQKSVRYFDFGASIHITNYDKLEEIAIQILGDDEKIVKELNIGREKIIELYNFRNDGNAAQRIYEILTS